MADTAPEFTFDSELPSSGTAAPDFSFSPEVQEPGPVRSITPRRIGQMLEQKMLPALEQTQRQAEDERLSRAAGAQMELGAPAPAYERALSALGSAADVMTGGASHYIPAALAKGAGKMGISGFERFADMPLVDVKKEAERKVQAASTLHPGYALTGQAAGLGLGAATMPAVAASKGPAASGALTGALYGGVSAGAKEADPYEALKGAALGSVLGGVGAPIIERAASGLTRLVRGGRPVVTSSGNLTDEAVSVAKSAGLTDSEIQTLAPYLKQTFERRGITPEAAKEARFAEFGLEPTRGMVTGEPAQLAREKTFGAAQPLAEQAAEAARQKVGGTGASLRDAVEDAVSKGGAEAARLKNAYGAAYSAAESIPGKFDRASISGVGDRIRNVWATDPGKLDFYASDIARKAAQDLDSVLGASIPVGAGVSVTHQTFRAVESGRKILNAALGSAKNQTDRAAVRKMIDDFDNHIDQSITNGAFSGDPRVVGQWRQARKLFSEYQNRYGVRRSGEESGTLMKQILDGTKSPQDVANMMFNFSAGDATMKRDAIKTFLQLRRALGPNSPELDQIKKSYIEQLMTPTAAKAGESVGPKDFARTSKQIMETLRGRGASFTRMAISPDERAYLERYARVMAEAGRVAPNDMPEKVNKLVQLAQIATPMVASGASYALALLDPKVAATIGAIGAIKPAVSAIKQTEMVQKSLANRPPPTVARPYRYPSVRTGLPLATSAAPEAEENYENVRAARASGGRVSHEHLVNRLMKACVSAKKDEDGSTKPLLDAPDEHIVKALDVAQRAL